MLLHDVMEEAKEILAQLKERLPNCESRAIQQNVIIYPSADVVATKDKYVSYESHGTTYTWDETVSFLRLPRDLQTIVCLFNQVDIPADFKLRMTWKRCGSSSEITWQFVKK